MHLVLTPDLIRFLIRQGYKYCLSKTAEPGKLTTGITITLTPTQAEPDIRNLPEKCDTYFDIEEEPVQLAQGVDDTLVMVQLDKITVLDYINFLTNPIKAWRVAHG